MTEPVTVNRENMQLWVDALRSGQFQQGQGHLSYCNVERKGHGLTDSEKRGPVKNCCLGVATEIAIYNGVSIQVTESHRSDRITFDYDNQRDFLPTAVRDWLGLNSSNPELIVALPNGTTLRAKAAALNDGVAEVPTSCQDQELVIDETGEQCWVRTSARYLPNLSFAEIADAIERTYLGQADAQTD